MNAFNTDFAADALDGPSLTALTGQVWCFDPQALVATPGGPREAARLCAGDVVFSAHGHRVKLLCSVEIVLRHHPAPDKRLGWPLLIRANAIGDLLPTCDMRLPAWTRILPERFPSAETAALANGATITRLPPTTAGLLWRVLVCEASAPHPLIANGLAILGTPLRPGDDIDIALHQFTAPLLPPTPPFDLPQGSGHADLRRSLADTALVLGHTRISDPGLLLLQGHRLIEPECDGAWCRFAFPHDRSAPPHRVTLLSRHAIPAEVIGNSEKRRLGVAVSRVDAGGREVALTHWALCAGWHEPEPGWRWTDGRAEVLVPPAAREIAFEIANILPAYNLPQTGDIPCLRTPIR